MSLNTATISSGAVDGGLEHLRRCCDSLEDYIELSATANEEEEKTKSQ